MAIAFTCVALRADAAPLLELVATIPLPGVKGRIDHLAADPQDRRMYVAALGNGTVEVVDAAGHRRSLAGFAEPQGIAYVPASNRIFVANGQGDRVDVLDASTLDTVARIAGLADADNVRHDEAAGTILVGHGKGALAILDARDGAKTGDIALPGHPESFQLEHGGPRVFVNVPSARKVVIADRVKRTTVASWDVPAAANFPMALDETGRRLFVGARSPAVLLVYDIDSGKVVSRIPIGADTDDLFFDAERKRIYAVCGEGRVDVVRQESPGHYSLEGSVETAPRARTGLLVPEERKLYIAAPAADGSPARILVFRIP